MCIRTVKNQIENFKPTTWYILEICTIYYPFIFCTAQFCEGCHCVISQDTVHEAVTLEKLKKCCPHHAITDKLIKQICLTHHQTLKFLMLFQSILENICKENKVKFPKRRISLNFLYFYLLRKQSFPTPLRSVLY